MRLVMSYSGGTYRGVQLASEFDRMGSLSGLFLPYYSAKHPLLTFFFRRIEDKQNIDKGKVNTNMPFCLFRKILSRTEGLRKIEFNHMDRLFLGKRWDNWVASKLKSEADSILCESVFGLNSMRRAKRLGMKTFLDSLTSHIIIQDRILREESVRYGFSYSMDRRYVDRLLKEYEVADYIIVPSRFVRDGFISMGFNEEKVICVTPGIDLSYFKPVKKEDDVFRVIYCGILGYKKGVQYLLEAFRSLALKKAELLFIGHIHSNFRKVLEKYSGWFRHVDFLPNYELYREYSQGSVFVFPSLEDSFGKVTVEAMACGLPAIVTENSGSKDVVRDGVDGFIVPVRDTESLKKKLLFLYEDKRSRREMGENAMRRARQEFNLEKYYKRITSAIEGRL